MAPASAPSKNPCTHCGAVLPLSAMVKVDQEGEWVYACQDCAVEVSTGKGPEKR
jgi:coenzyme F420-reducing hydrogenase beta subunit